MSPLIQEMIAARRRARRTQADVAEAMGVGTSRTTVTNWESGLASPRLEDFMRWSSAVGLVVLVVPRADVTEQTDLPPSG